MFQEIRQAAEFLELTHLSALLSTIQTSQQLISDEALQLYSNVRRLFTDLLHLTIFYISISLGCEK